MCEKSRKILKRSLLPMLCGSGRSRSRLAKAAGAQLSGRMGDQESHAAVVRRTCRSQNVRSGALLKSAAGRSTCRSQNARKHHMFAACMKRSTFMFRGRRNGAQNFSFLRMSHTLVSFWTCELPLLKQASHNCFLSDRNIDG